MAEGVLLNFVAGFAANVASETFKKIRLSLGVKDELRKLNNTLSVIEAVLLDAEEKQTRDNRVKVWLDRLEEVIYDADNLVDEFHYQHFRRKVLFGKKKARKVRIFFSRSSNQLFFRYKMAKKLKKLGETLDEIKADQVFLQLDKPDSEETRGPSKMSERETHSFVSDEEVIGRDDDKKKIIKLLSDNDSENKENVSIVSLVGFGGLGKTTLAKFVFNNEEIKEHFKEQTYWVCVSNVFDLKLLVQKIIRSVTDTSPDQNLDLEQLQKQLREKIKGKKYLLVLDDVWNEDGNKWDDLNTILKVGAKGSRVLITTRSKTVAQIVNSKTHMLRGLDDDRSWALFERVVFGKRNCEPTAQYHRLEEIGKDIVKKCGGVPLAIKTIGRLLSNMQNLESKWKSFRDTKLAEINYGKQNDILPTLKLSYNNLLPHLKHCFAFCSLFPKDYEIDVQQLITLWNAQGFIEYDEQIGYDCFMILLSGCFFQEAEQDKLLETVKSCKMHDLMHDLASSVAGKSIKILDEKCIKDENRAEKSFEKVRHVFCLKYDCLDQSKTQFLEQKKMRTFILHEFECLTSSDCNDILSNLKLLRALSFRIESNTLPNSMGKLKHLRYLNLSSNKLKELPNSITELYNLRTLILSKCEFLVSLPVDIKNLINLRHLEIYGCRKLTHMPRGICELTLLQTLDMFVVAANQSSESAGFGELGKLNNLRGRLVIKIKGLGESGAAQCLKDKKHLESLVLNWEVEQDTIGNTKVALECLEPPHQNMKALEVNSYPGETFPPNWLSSLTDLVRLRLAGFKECKYLPPLHHLSSLQNLELYNLSALEYVSNRDREWDQGDHLSTSARFFLPSLKSLKIGGCTSLKGWWGRERKDVGEVVGPLTEYHQQHPFFSSLTILEISNCPLLVTMPLFPNLEKLELYDTSSKPLEQTIMMKLKSDGVATTSSASSSSSSSCPLSKLKNLDIYTASDFESLPKAIKNLSSLTQLTISDCSNLASLPEGIGSLSSLTRLTIKGCSSLASLPEGIGSLSSLTGLTIEGCSSLASLPEGIGSLSSLRRLTIEGCSSLASLLEGIGSLSSLTDLRIGGCSSLASLPEGIGSLSSLTDLRIGGCSSLASLPEGIGSLSSLTDLTIGGCSSLASLPEGIGSLSSLTDLRIGGCSSLASLPEGIGSLSSLTHLTIGGCSSLTSLPERIGSLSSLTHLTIEGCNSLASLPERIGSLSSLTHLTIEGCSSLASLPERIGSLSSLTHLTIEGCSSLASLPERIGSLSSLIHLTIEGCSSLASLPERIGSLSSLRHLTIEGCSSLASLPEGIGSLSSLTHLTIEGCSSLASLPEGIGSLSSLTHLRIQGCSSLASLPERIGSLSSLTHLRVEGCSSLASLPERIGSLSSLTHLRIQGCSSLASLPEGIGSLSSLTDLRIEGCSSFASLPEGIGSLSSLTDLRIEGCSSFASLPEGIGSLSSLTDLIIEGCSSLASLPEGIGSLSSLTDLRIEGCSSLASLPEGIGSLSSLTHLRMEGSSSLASLPERIGSLSSLIHLRIEGSSSLASLPERIGSLSSLIHLTIEGCSSLASLPERIGSLSSLTDLRIEGCSSLASLPEGIGSLSSLTYLRIQGCSSLASLPERIGSLSSLTDLRIEGCSSLASLPEGIGSLSSLTYLRIQGCSSLASLPEGIGSLLSLKWVNGKSCTQIPMNNALAEYLLQQNRE